MYEYCYTVGTAQPRDLFARYAAKVVKKFNLLFSPEFLHKSKALYDNLYPSRIIVGRPKLLTVRSLEKARNYSSSDGCRVSLKLSQGICHSHC